MDRRRVLAKIQGVDGDRAVVRLDVEDSWADHPIPVLAAVLEASGVPVVTADTTGNGFFTTDVDLDADTVEDLSFQNIEPVPPEEVIVRTV